MKKSISILLAMILSFGVFAVMTSAEENYPNKRDELFIRDPWVLTFEGKYYMYGTGLSRGEGYGCVVSEDMENWSAPVQIFSPDSSFDGYDNYWAPECHYYGGSFYLFATYKSEASGKRGVGIFKADSPLGKFELITDGHITPKDIDCIDGTLYVDDDGQPWMVYVNEWTSTGDGIGEMAAAKLSDDLTRFVSEPIVLFRANRHLWTNEHVTDGPYLHKTEYGSLVMLWSNITEKNGYAVGMAVSSNGKIDGNWIHQPTELYSRKYFSVDGGHPMIFKAFDGKMYLSIHSPNETQADGTYATALFLPIYEKDNLLVIEGNEPNKIEQFFIDLYYNIFIFIFDLFDSFKIK